MKQEYSLAHLTVMGLAPPELVYVAARAGYDYVSPRLIYMGLPGEPNWALAEKPEMLRRTRTALAATGVRVHDVELARILMDVEPESYEPAIAVAAELGARAVLSSIWTGAPAMVVAKFGRLCDLAARYGLTVDLEPVPVAAVTNLAQALDVLRAVKRDNAGLMIDTHHFHRARDRVEALDAVPRAWFHFAQICDAPAEIPADRERMIHIMRAERLYCGEGGIDIAGILAHLPRMPWSIELPHLARSDEMGYAEHAFRCLETAKAYFAAHARGAEALATR